jgi:hypothetical protein
MLKGILKDREVEWNDELKEVIVSAWNGLTCDAVQSVFATGTAALHDLLRIAESIFLDQ